MSREAPLEPPILTDIVELHATGSFRRLAETAASSGYTAGLLPEEDLAALQAALVTRTMNLTDELLNSAARELAAVIFEQVMDRLRAALPELVAGALREHLGTGPE
ncbi:MAG: hypothetical protein FJ191_05705 [Gammaproteobacteria bacterium]|nr:hypothetical protein [Gammaproteobacteria bacterium]